MKKIKSIEIYHLLNLLGQQTTMIDVVWDNNMCSKYTADHFIELWNGHVDRYNNMCMFARNMNKWRELYKTRLENLKEMVGNDNE
jgi:hypothetical protein